MRHGDSGWLSLHPGEFCVLWDRLGLGELPDALGLARGGRTSAARAALRDSAELSLRERDLGSVDDPDPDVVTLLRALASGRLRLELEVAAGGEVFRALGTSGPDGHVTAGAGEGELEIKLGPVSESSLVATLLAPAGDVRAGVGASGNVPVEDYRRACRAGQYGGADAFLQVMREAGARPPEANSFLRAVGRAHAVGRLGGTADDGAGQRRVPGVLTWVDTADGRYVLRQRGGWVTVTPADAARLVAIAEDFAAAVA
ncbi:ESX secretion-associated protein EspG [Saccharomonospora piscinae]|uniref:ESX secretion-associated protein EspG n=1 Tax=Saccharomonospora piscinae TaxID=687388 RepID=UPI000467712C|nr:ESX secretion-associated protein EspG [Saccharomonospora piscinae]